MGGGMAGVGMIHPDMNRAGEVVHAEDTPGPAQRVVATTKSPSTAFESSVGALLIAILDNFSNMSVF